MLLPIPSELFSTILLYLQPRDIVACSRVSKDWNDRCTDDYLWQTLLSARFGHKVATDIPEGKTHKQVFIELSDLRVPATSMRIVHLNNTYWRIIPEKDGLRPENGGIAQLRSVCWLALEGDIKAVPVGRYSPVWSLNVDPYARSLDHITFSASCDKDSAHSGNPPTNVSRVVPNLQSQAGTGWFDLACRPFEVRDDKGSAFVDVHFCAEDFSPVWKSGLFVAGVTLRRERDEDHAAREEEQQQDEQEKQNDEHPVWTSMVHGVRRIFGY